MDGLVDGVVEPAMAIGAINVPTYFCTSAANDAKENPTPLYEGGGNVRNHDIHPQGLVFCMRSEVANRSSTLAHRNNPAFQSWNGLGTWSRDSSEGKHNPDKLAWTAVRAKAILEKEVFLMGVAVNPVRAKFTDTPGAFTTQVMGQSTIIPAANSIAGDIMGWNAPSVSTNSVELKRYGPNRRREAEIRPIDSSYLYDRGTYYRDRWTRQQAEIELYKADRDSIQSANSNDEYESIINIQEFALLAAAAGVAAFVRNQARALVETGGDTSNDGLKKVRPLGFLLNEKKADHEPQDYIEKSVDDATSWFASHYGLVSIGSNPLTKVQLASRRFLTTAIFDPDSFKASDAPIKKELTSASGAIRSHLGFVTAAQFTKTAKCRLLHSKHFPRLERRLACAFPNLIMTTTQFYLEVDRRKLGMMVSSAPKGKQGHIILGARR